MYSINMQNPQNKKCDIFSKCNTSRKIIFKKLKFFMKSPNWSHIAIETIIQFKISMTMEQFPKVIKKMY